MRQSLSSLKIRVPIPVMCAVLAHPPLAGGAATCDFDDGTMQGWSPVPPQPANQSFAAGDRLAWNSRPGRSDTLRYTTDLSPPGIVVQSGIPSAGTATAWPSAGDPPAAATLFFHLEEESP